MFREYRVAVSQQTVQPQGNFAESRLPATNCNDCSWLSEVENAAEKICGHVRERPYLVDSYKLGDN